MAITKFFGLTITYNSSFFQAIIKGVSGVGGEAMNVETIHTELTNGFALNQPGGVKRLKPLQLRVQHDGSKDWKSALGAAAETITITYPLMSGESSAATLAFSGYMSDYEAQGEVTSTEPMEATVTLMPSGEPTITAAS